MAKSPYSPFGKNAPPIPQMPKVALDRFGHLIEPGHLLMYHAPNDMILEVVAVHPVVNPNAQGGLAMQITLEAKFNIQAGSGIPSGSLVIVGETQARIAAKAANNGKSDVVGPSSQADGHAEPPNEGPKLILTDALDAPVDQGDVTDGLDGKCDRCGDLGTSGKPCTECGVGIYQA